MLEISLLVFKIFQDSYHFALGFKLKISLPFQQLGFCCIFRRKKKRHTVSLYLLVITLFLQKSKLKNTLEAAATKQPKVLKESENVFSFIHTEFHDPSTSKHYCDQMATVLFLYFSFGLLDMRGKGRSEAMMSFLKLPFAMSQIQYNHYQ